MLAPGLKFPPGWWQFIAPRTAADSKGEVQASTLHAAYTEWARAQRFETLTQAAFGRGLAELGLQSVKRGGLVRYTGIRLNGADDQAAAFIAACAAVAEGAEAYA
jgi:hypothetical protein